MEEKESAVPQDSSSLVQKVQTQAQEIERLGAEVKKLRKCVRGVNVLGKCMGMDLIIIILVKQEFQ